MRVGQRLFLAVVPGLLGLGAVAGLAYWGEYGRQAPELLVAVAAVAMILSLLLAWSNTRYVARRIEALAPRRHAASRPGQYLAALRGRGALEPDELDAIEGAVSRLEAQAGELQTLLDASRATQQAEARRLGTLLLEAAQGLREHAAQARVPLHILLEHAFGELNENQEELVADASAQLVLAERRLSTVARIGALLGHPDAVAIVRVSVDDVLKDVAAKLGPALTVDIPPALPAVRGDAALMRELLFGVLTDAGGAWRVTAAIIDAGVELSIRGSAPPDEIMSLMGPAVMGALGGTWRRDGTTVTITIPRW